MAEQHGSRRLTRADVLVIAAVCLLLILLVPVLFARPREVSIRRLCAANLAQIGKAMLVYADDYEGILPRAGGPSTIWGPMPNLNSWMAVDRRVAFGMASDGTGGTAPISASLYLLVRHSQMLPRVFVCKGDRGTTEFKLSQCTGLRTGFELTDAWDFGWPSDAPKRCSYAYHIPYGRYALDTSLNPNLAVAADRNPWIMSPASPPGVWTDFKPDIEYLGGLVGTSVTACQGNSITHQRDGQNVLFLDGRVTFERRAYCAVGKDNIYTLSDDILWGKGSVRGISPIPTAHLSPTNRSDSLLVHDPPPMRKERR